MIAAIQNARSDGQPSASEGVARATKDQGLKR